MPKPSWCTKPSPCDYDKGTSYCPHRECRSALLGELDEAQKLLARACFCDSEDGTQCQEHARWISLIREMVAWFDVMHSKYVVDGTPVDLSEEWPSDWMRRAREAVTSDPLTGDER